jgi:hypothetical protein
MIEIRKLKENYILKYPNSKVSSILIGQPEYLTPESFITLAKALLSAVKDG